MMPRRAGHGSHEKRADMHDKLFTVHLNAEDRRDLEELTRLLYSRRILPMAYLSGATRYAWRFTLAALQKESGNEQKI